MTMPTRVWDPIEDEWRYEPDNEPSTTGAVSGWTVYTYWSSGAQDA